MKKYHHRPVLGVRSGNRSRVPYTEDKNVQSCRRKKDRPWSIAVNNANEARKIELKLTREGLELDALALG